MTENKEHKSLEVVSHQGAKYVRLNPNDVSLNKMTAVEKIGDVVAAQVAKGSVKVITKQGKEIETINFANEGDWVVYDIGSSDFKKLFQKLLYGERRSISKENFPVLYRRVEGEVELYAEDQFKVMQDIVIDNSDNAGFVDASFVKNLKYYRYVGKQVYAAVVPYNFVILAPWGKDQFIKKGGMIIYDPNIQAEKGREIYGIDGARNRVPGVFEKTFSVAGGSHKVIADTFKEAIRADRSPIAGIQYDNIDLAKAYDRAGKNIPGFLQKFLKD